MQGINCVCLLSSRLEHSTLVEFVFGVAAASSTQNEMKKSARRDKHCALAVVRRSQKFSPRRRSSVLC